MGVPYAEAKDKADLYMVRIEKDKVLTTFMAGPCPCALAQKTHPDSTDSNERRQQTCMDVTEELHSCSW